MNDNQFESIPLDDPILVAAVDSQIGPFTRIYPPSVLKRMRSELTTQLSVHPYVVELVKAIREPKPVNKTEDRPTSNGADEEPARSSGNGSRSPR